MSKKSKSKCCKKFRKKSKACSSCPVMACLDKKAQKDLIRRYRKKKAA